MIFVNFKTYPESSGSRAVDLLQKVVSAQVKLQVPIVPVVSFVDARLCVNTSSYGVWVQHVDGIEPGRNTGFVSPEMISGIGVVGTFLNHSEHKFGDARWEELEFAVLRCRGLGIETMVFAGDIEELERASGLNPNYLCYEPSELVGSVDTSVARAKPEVIARAVQLAKKFKIHLIVGAGVKDGGDVIKSLELGAFGVAVSSAVVLASDPYEVLVELGGGFGR